jgi:hypothetical protein
VTLQYWRTEDKESKEDKGDATSHREEAAEGACPCSLGRSAKSWKYLLFQCDLAVVVFLARIHRGVGEYSEEGCQMYPIEENH